MKNIIRELIKLSLDFSWIFLDLIHQDVLSRFKKICIIKFLVSFESLISSYREGSSSSGYRGVLKGFLWIESLSAQHTEGTVRVWFSHCLEIYRRNLLLGFISKFWNAPTDALIKFYLLNALKKIPFFKTLKANKIMTFQ